MFQLLYKYLVLNKKVVIPGIGVLSVDNIPAKFDFENRLFKAPVQTVKFEASNFKADPNFYRFLAVEQHIGENEAEKIYIQFASNLATRLQQLKRVEIPGIGVLLKNSGQFVFQNVLSLTDYFPDAALDRKTNIPVEVEPVASGVFANNEEQGEIIATDSEQSNTKKDLWWVYALILAILAIGVIVYYYFENGGFE